MLKSIYLGFLKESKYPKELWLLLHSPWRLLHTTWLLEHAFWLLLHTSPAPVWLLLHGARSPARPRIWMPQPSAYTFNIGFVNLFMTVKTVVATAAGLLVSGCLLMAVSDQLSRLPDSYSPALATPLKVRTLSVNAFNACGVTLDGNEIVCWGPPGLPRGNVDPSPGPKNIGLRGTFVNLYGGGLAFCGVTASHNAQCWGSSAFGQTGTQMTVNSPEGDPVAQGTMTPYPLADFDGSVKAMAAGRMHFCALTDDQNVWCWGTNNKGILATDDDAVMVETPSRVSFFDGDATAVFAGFLSTCASTESGKLYCWGLHGADNPTRFSTSPEEIQLPGPAQLVALGQARSCAVVSGELYCWGIRPNEARTQWEMDASPVKQEFAGAGITSVATNGLRSCLVQAGDVKCWGRPSASTFQASLADYSESLEVIPEINGQAVEVALGDYMTCARLIDSTVKCWGEVPDKSDPESVKMNLGNFSDEGSKDPVTVLTPVRVLSHF
ncbi:RCC1 domain-containing protein [Comamonas thiooxydans]|uniref:RCC1 domain-containing protein n=1 Tax=Comamonas thiooxydans TaxID=363952 RepID=UPI0011867191|nr:hypothetical protein [Comamonas thiooxydans]